MSHGSPRPYVSSTAFADNVVPKWQTTWDRGSLFTDVSPSTPITFAAPGAAASVDIQIDDSAYFQTMVGHGASLSEPPGLSTIILFSGFTSYAADSSAKLLNQLKVGAPIRPLFREGIIALTDCLHSRKTLGTIGR